MGIKYTSLIKIPNVLGVQRATGVIPFDLNKDGVSDLIFFPSTFNTGQDLNAFSITSSPSAAMFSEIKYWGQSFKTGNSGPWIIADFNNDGYQDIFWFNSGLELPVSEGGFQFGRNSILLSNASSGWNLESLPGEKLYTAGDVIFLDKSTGLNHVLTTSFSSTIHDYIFSPDGSVTLKEIVIGTVGGSPFNWSQPGGLARVHMQNGNDGVIIGSYREPSGPNNDGVFILYDFKNANLSLANIIRFPDDWVKDNLGAFAVLSGDFRGVGYDDFIALGETSYTDNNYIRDVRYFSQVNGSFVDTTAVNLPHLVPKLIKSDMLVPFDVNNDGHVDLVGFSWRSSTYVTGSGLFINDGLGHFDAVIFGDPSMEVGNYPIFSTNLDGSWKSLIGIYGVSTPDLEHIQITQWLADQAVSTGKNLTDPCSKGAAGFNEYYYLNTHLDAQTAVKNGVYADGLDFYLAIGRARNDEICAPNTKIVGTQDNDSFKFNAPMSHFTITMNSGACIVVDNVGQYGADTLFNIEKIQFSDFSINTTMKGEAAKLPTATVKSLTELYVAYFARTPDASGLAYWIDKAAAGESLTEISKEFYNAGVQFSSLTGYSATMANSDFIKIVYTNVLGRSGATAPPVADVAYWDNQIKIGATTKEGLIQTMLTAAHSFANDPTWGWVPKLLDNKISVGYQAAVTYGLDYNSSSDAITQGMAIAHAVTPTDTAAAVALIGVAGHVLL